MRNNYPVFSALVGLLCLFGYGTLQAQTFGNELPIPDTLDGSVIEIDVDATFHDFDPNQIDPEVTTVGTFYKNNVPTFGYNPHGIEDNTYLGPTLIWHHGQPQTTNVYNNIDERTTVHWHGAHIPARTDGGPHQPIDTGQVWSPSFDVMDDVTTLWYHPHLEDSTFIQVEMGLSGIIIVEDASDTLRAQLPHTYGVDDVPVIVQDRQFVLDSTNSSQPYTIKTTQNGGPTVIINGVVGPYVNAGPQMMRFRVLNGSSRQAYLLSVVDSNDISIPFWLTGSDAGYLPAPMQVDSFATGPGIRNEFVIDLRNYGGQNLYLKNNAATLGNLWPGKVVSSGADVNIMEIRVGNTALGSNPILTPPPSQFPPYEMFPVDSVTRTRIKELQGESGNPGPQVDYSINGNQFILEHLNDTIKLDSTEKWVIYNTSDVAHPFHIHDVHVDVIVAFDENRDSVLPMPAEYVGRQDNILIPSGWEVQFVTTFADFGDTLWIGDPERSSENGYMYHCHILTHEDGYYAGNTNLSPHGMMQQFLVWNGVTIMTDAPESVEHMGEMLFYPNPATDVLYLQGASKVASEFCVFDLAGKMVLRHELAPFDGVKSFDVGGFSPGMYVVEWRNARGDRFSKKIVMQR